jgi:hypothetical protein
VLGEARHSIDTHLGSEGLADVGCWQSAQDAGPRGIVMREGIHLAYRGVIESTFPRFVYSSLESHGVYFLVARSDISVGIDLVAHLP